MHIVKDSSDHLPILLKLHGSNYRPKPCTKLFEFENLWLTHESCANIVKSGWDVSANCDMKGVAK